MEDYKPFEFEENNNVDDTNWFNTIKEKYRTCRAQILPTNQWEPFICEWIEKNPNKDEWFVLHVKTNTNPEIYEKALKTKGFPYSVVHNQYRSTPTYLETPLNGLSVDEHVMLDVIQDMTIHNNVLYYRNIPAPIVDRLYKDVFEERLAYPERFE